MLDIVPNIVSYIKSFDHRLFRLTINSRDNITKNVHSIIYRPFGLYGRYEWLNTYKQVLNRISVQEITIPNIKM